MTIRNWTMVFLVIISGWIVSAAYLVNIETADGYSIIANAKFFLGQTEQYFAERGPFSAFLLVPVEWILTYLEFPIFEVRAYHLFYGLLHILYIWVVYALLRRYHDNEVVILLAFLATIPNFLFFSYAPFLSTDIYPGAIFLYMLLLAQQFGSQPTWRIWWLLLFLGTIAPLIKHTYALFWLVTLLVQGLPLLFGRQYRRFFWLLSGAMLSAGLTWLILSLLLRGWKPELPFLSLPYHQIALVAAHNAPLIDTGAWPGWFYLRNFSPGYGVLVTLLILTGILLGLCSKNSLEKRLTAAWILAFVMINLIPYKETRYLLFLAPLTAFIVVIPIQMVLQQRRQWLPVMVLLLMIDLARSATEAAQVYTHFFVSNPITHFLRVIEDTSHHQRPIVMATSLSFVSQVYSPLIGDRYHYLFHLHPKTIKLLYGQRNAPEVILFPSVDKALGQLNQFPEKTVLLLANSFIVREMGQRGHYLPTEMDGHMQMAAFTVKVVYKRLGNHFVRDDLMPNHEPLFVFHPAAGENKPSLIPLDNKLSADWFKSYDYIPADTVEISGLRMTALCQLDQCQFFTPEASVEPAL